MRIAPRAGASSSEVKPYVVPNSQEFDGNDGEWSTFKINVGGQDMRVLASTKSGETYVIVPEGCLPGDPADCPQQRGAGILNSAQSRGFQTSASKSWSDIGQYEVNLEKNLNYTAKGMYGHDTVSLGPADNSLSIEKQVVVGVASLDYFIGHIPLGTPDSSFCTSCAAEKPLLYQLRHNEKIPSLSFAYTAGAKYQAKSPQGQLILGGYDKSRFKPNANDLSFTFSTDPTRLLTVGVQSILASNTLKGSYSLSSSAHFSLVDSTVPHLWLPRDICDAFEAAFGLIYDPTKDLYRINATNHATLKTQNPEITLKLGNELEGGSTNIKLPYSAFIQKASYPYFNQSIDYFPIRRAANDSQFTLGRTFLQEAYMIVDYERGNFSLSQATFPDRPSETLVTITSPNSPTSSQPGLSPGAIAGIVVGISLSLIAIAGALFFLLRRRRARQRSNSQISSSSTNNPNNKSYKFPKGARELDAGDDGDMETLTKQEYYQFKGGAMGSNNQSLSELASPGPVTELSDQTFTPPVELPASTQYYEMEGDFAASKVEKAVRGEVR